MLPDQTEPVILRHVSIRDGILQTLLAIVCFVAGLWFSWIVWAIKDDLTNLDATLVLSFAAIASFVASGYFGRLVITSSVREVKIDFAGKWVEATRYGISGKRSERYHFHQIERFRSYKAKRFLSSRSRHYSLEIILASGKKIRIRVTIASVKTETTKFIKLLNKTLRQSR